MPLWGYLIPVGVVGAVGIFATSQKQDISQQSEPVVGRTGDYTATVSYQVPSGSESITVTTHLENDVITEVDAVHSGNDRKSARAQQSFDSVYKSLVIGKKISDLQLNAVSGASLTTVAFLQAIEKLQ